MAYYRWMWRTIWPNLRGYYRDFKNGWYNMRTFFPAVWHFRAWDWTGMARFMQVASIQMRDHHRDYGVTVDRDRTARQLTIVATLLSRLLADDYFSNAGHSDTGWPCLTDRERRAIALHAEYMNTQDVQVLCRMLLKLRHWWD